MIMPYSVSKTALLGLTKALSYELAPDNIRVNCIAPGIIDTKFAGAVSCFRFFYPAAVYGNLTDLEKTFSRLTTLCTHLIGMRIASLATLYTTSGYVMRCMV